jgi:hypothetical protein
MWRVSKEPRQTTIVPLGDNKLVGILVTAEKSMRVKAAITNPANFSTRRNFKHQALSADNCKRSALQPHRFV